MKKLPPPVGRSIVTLLLSLAVGGCASLSTRSKAESRANAAPTTAEGIIEESLEPAPAQVVSDEEPETDPSKLDADALAAIRQVENEIKNLDAEIQGDLPAHQQGKRPGHIPLEFNARVEKWIRYFAVQDRERFARFLSRGFRYKSVVQEALKRNGVPQDLFYLALIESGYQIHARSHAKAVGPWQFIAGTAKRFGLQLNAEIDERRDIIESTEAAARYLKGLYTAFQSWYLAMASYNAGEMRILGAVVRGHSRDFWELVERKSLPAETRDYVPKFLAAMIIGRNLQKYGFSGIAFDEFPKVEAASVPGGVKLSTIASLSGVPQRSLMELNPQLLRARTPAHATDAKIWVRSGDKEKIESLRERLAGTRVKSRLRGGVHGNARDTVRGEGRGSRAVAARSSATHGKRIIHRVRRGEGLQVISKRYGVPVKRIKKANRLRNSRLFVGQRLKIPADV